MASRYNGSILFFPIAKKKNTIFIGITMFVADARLNISFQCMHRKCGFIHSSKVFLQDALELHKTHQTLIII